MSMGEIIGLSVILLVPAVFFTIAARVGIEKALDGAFLGFLVFAGLSLVVGTGALPGIAFGAILGSKLVSVVGGGVGAISALLIVLMFAREGARPESKRDVSAER